MGSLIELPWWQGPRLGMGSAMRISIHQGQPGYGYSHVRLPSTKTTLDRAPWVIWQLPDAKLITLDHFSS